MAVRSATKPVKKQAEKPAKKHAAKKLSPITTPAKPPRAKSAAKAVDEQLARYRSMRDFQITAEPSGSTKSDKNENVTKYPFCIQKHAASHLHYDFRLGWNGVLKSWAVAKGPSYSTKDKRLVVVLPCGEDLIAGLRGAGGEWGRDGGGGSVERVEEKSSVATDDLKANCLGANAECRRSRQRFGDGSCSASKRAGGDEGRH